MDSRNATVDHPLNDQKKLVQLNALLDKAKLYSQFIGQQVQESTANIYSSEKAKAEENSANIEEVKEENGVAQGEDAHESKKRGRHGQKKEKEKKSLAQTMLAFDGKAPGERKALAQPPLVTGGQLRSYQEEGLNWLIQLYENGINGILADEMGLGKTIMTISFLAHLWGKGVCGPFIVVSPLSTLQNWINEFSRWAPSLPAVLYHGTKNEREELQTDILSARKKRKTSESSSIDAAHKLPILITSYEIAVRDRQFLQKLKWKYMVVDEGHRLKNFNCRLIRELKALHSENRLLLTGTPLQNNLTELWSLLNFILPDVFDSLENFQSWFDFDEVVDSSAQGETKAEVEDKVATDLVTKLHAILQPFLLRRLKSDIPNLQIPVKKQVVLYCPFTEPQKVFYDLIKMRDFDYLVQQLANTGSAKSVRVQNIIMQLRKVCNHPFQFDEVFDSFYEEFQKRTSCDPDATPASTPKAKKRGKKVAASSSKKDAAEDLSPNGRPARRNRKKVDYSDAADPFLLGLGSSDSAIDSDEDEKVPSRTKPTVEKLQQDDDQEDADHRLQDIAKAQSAQPIIKRSLNSFMTFCGEKRNELKKQGKPFSMDYHRVWALEWKALPSAQREVFEQRAQEDRVRYLAAMEQQRLAIESNIIVTNPEKYVQDLVAACGKMQLLHRMLPTLQKNGHRCLIFSQFTRMLDILEDYLDYSGYKYCRIDGAIAQKDRQVAIDTFNKDTSYFCFLLSTRAGGLGINLTGADTVIIYDSDWNPQMDLQAQDRCHRIGQTKPVVVFRFATANSVESKILRRASNKLKLERLIIHKDRFKGAQRRVVSDQELLEILSDDQVDGALGGEKTISEADLARVLDRQECLNLFASRSGETNLATMKKSASGAADNEQPEEEGYELVNEEGDGQGGLAI